MDQIPIEIIRIIFLNLSMKDRIICRLVCNLWKENIDDSVIWKIHDIPITYMIRCHIPGIRWLYNVPKIPLNISPSDKIFFIVLVCNVSNDKSPEWLFNRLIVDDKDFITSYLIVNDLWFRIATQRNFNLIKYFVSTFIRYQPSAIIDNLVNSDCLLTACETSKQNVKWFIRTFGVNKHIIIYPHILLTSMKKSKTMTVVLMHEFSLSISCFGLKMIQEFYTLRIEDIIWLINILGIRRLKIIECSYSIIFNTRLYIQLFDYLNITSSEMLYIYNGFASTMALDIIHHVVLVGSMKLLKWFITKIEDVKSVNKMINHNSMQILLLQNKKFVKQFFNLFKYNRSDIYDCLFNGLNNGSISKNTVKYIVSRCGIKKIPNHILREILRMSMEEKNTKLTNWIVGKTGMTM
jgi:hypothetical protein